jgi:hypothetical protein
MAAILHAHDDDPATLAPRRLMGQRQGFCLMGMQQRITPHGKAVCYQGSQLGT